MKVIGYAAAMLVVFVLTGCGGGSGGGSPVNVATVQYSGLPEDASRYYRSVVPPGTSRMTVTLANMNTDGDLWLRSVDGLECESGRLGTMVDECLLGDPTPGNWEIEVENYGPGSLDFRLTVKLEPSDRVATLEFIRQSGSASMQAEDGDGALIRSRNTELPRQLETYLSAIKAVVLQAHEHEVEGNLVLSGAVMEGKGRLSKAPAVGSASVDFRLKIRGNDQHPVLVRSTKPVLLDPHSGVPQEGLAILDGGAEGLVEVRFGSDTGTGADIQVVAEPGPVVSELSWEELTGHWQVELQDTPSDISARGAVLFD